MVKPVHVCTVLFILSFGLSGCQQKEPPLPLKADSAKSHTFRKEPTIVVPDDVKGKWKAVKIAVLDKSISKETIYTIPIGDTFTLPKSSMTILVESFLPAFVIEGANMTSSGNELKNPGAKVRISENGVVIFKAWLFSHYPATHAFMHPRYGFTLINGVPATPK